MTLPVNSFVSFPTPADDNSPHTIVAVSHIVKIASRKDGKIELRLSDSSYIVTSDPLSTIQLKLGI